jgi:Protein phosphatase 2C
VTAFHLIVACLLAAIILALIYVYKEVRTLKLVPDKSDLGLLPRPNDEYGVAMADRNSPPLYEAQDLPRSAKLTPVEGPTLVSANRTVVPDAELAEDYERAVHVMGRGSGLDDIGPVPDTPMAAPRLDPTSLNPGRGKASSDAAGTVQSTGDGVALIIGEAGLAPYAVTDLLSEPWGHPDTILDAGVIGPLHVRAVSSRGLSHRSYKRPRQDSYCLASGNSGGSFIIGVADGVGNSPDSHIGASIAVRQGCKLVSQQLLDVAADGIDWTKILENLSRTILAAHARRPAEDVASSTEPGLAMATTAIFAVLDAGLRPGDTIGVAIASYGDSSAWALRANRHWNALTPVKDEGEEITSSKTVALPNLVPAALAVNNCTIAANEALFLMSDGVGDPLGNGSGEVGRVLAELWSSPPSLFAFAAQVGFARRTWDDDRTVVGVWNREKTSK